MLQADEGGVIQPLPLPALQAPTLCELPQSEPELVWFDGREEHEILPESQFGLCLGGLTPQNLRIVPFALKGVLESSASLLQG